MMTFERVLDIFADYLVLDMEMEVCKSRYGYAAAWSAVPQRNFLIFFLQIMKAIWKSSEQRDAEM